MVRITKPYTTQFSESEDAVQPQLCIDQLKIDTKAKTPPQNGLKYEGIPLKIQNLDEELNEEILLQKFSKFGSILKTEIVYDEKLKKKKHAFLYFQSPAEAAKAIAHMNGAILLSRKISVTLASPRLKSRRPSTPSMQSLPFGGQYNRSQTSQSDLRICPHVPHSWASRSVRHSSSGSSVKSFHKPPHKTNSQ